MALTIWITQRSLQSGQSGTTLKAVIMEKLFVLNFLNFLFFCLIFSHVFFFFLVFFPLDLPDLFTPERGMLRTRSWFSARCYFSWLDKYFLLFFPFFLIFFVQEREENQDNNLINNNGPKYTRDILPTACHARAAVQLVHFDKHNSSNASRWNIAHTKKGRYFSLLRMICP